MKQLQQIKEALEILNVNSNAIKFFLTNYQVGKSSIGKIATAAKLDRSSAYLAYNQLTHLGLLEDNLSTTQKLVWAKSPETIIAKLRARIRKMKKQVENIETDLPELLASYNKQSIKPVLQFFSGKQGLQKISYDVLKNAGQEILLFSNQAKEKNVFSAKARKEFINTRLQKKIKIRVIATDTQEAHDIQKNQSKFLREVVITKNQIPFNNEIYIYGDKVAMLNFDKEILGFIVQSSEFAKTHRWMFEEIWAKHKKQGSKNQ